MPDSENEEPTRISIDDILELVRKSNSAVDEELMELVNENEELFTRYFSLIRNLQAGQEFQARIERGDFG